MPNPKPSFFKALFSRRRHTQQQRQTTTTYPASIKYLTCDAPNCQNKDPRVTPRNNEYLGYYYCSMKCLKSMDVHQVQRIKKLQEEQQQQEQNQKQQLQQLLQHVAFDAETIPVTEELVQENQTCAICLQELNI